MHHSSVHAPSVHKSWPLAEIARMSRRSVYKHDFEIFRQIKISRFRSHFRSEDFISKCLSWAPPLKAFAKTCRAKGTNEVSGTPPKERFIRLVVKYNCRWAGLQKRLKKCVPLGPSRCDTEAEPLLSAETTNVREELVERPHRSESCP